MPMIAVKCMPKTLGTVFTAMTLCPNWISSELYHLRLPLDEQDLLLAGVEYPNVELSDSQPGRLHSCVY